jgi:hypothetical protein
MNMFAGLLPLLVLVGIVVLIVKAVEARREGPAVSVGVLIRRGFQYIVMLIALGLSAFGVTGILEVVIDDLGGLTQDTDALARSVGFLVVGLPVLVGLALFTRTRLRSDPSEERSFGWAFYLTVALIGSLVGVLISGSLLLSDALTGDDLVDGAFVALVTWGAIWASHRFVADRFGDPSRMWVERLLGSFVGLSVGLVSGAIALAVVMTRIYASAVDLTVVGGMWNRLAQTLSVFIVAFGTWAWYWLFSALRDERRTIWTAYVLLAGVLSGVVMTVAGSATAVFIGFDWLFTNPGESAASFFEGVPAAIAVVIVGALSWTHHRMVLGSRVMGDRSEIDRIYDHILSAVGLSVTAGGIATLIAYAIRALAGVEITGSDGTVIAVAATLLVVGIPLWQRHWARLGREWRSDPATMSQSPSRRIYLPVVVGVSGLIAMISLTIFVSTLVESLLDGDGGTSTLDAVSIPLAIVVAAAVVAWYHTLALLADRAVAKDVEHHAVREVLLVSDNGETLAAAISEAHFRVRRLHAAGPPTVTGSIDGVIEALEAETHDRVMLVADGERYEVVPLS